MNNSTLTQADSRCRDIIVNAINGAPLGVTLRDILMSFPRKYRPARHVLVTWLEALEEEGAIEFEQYRSELKVYFLAGCTPRVRVFRTPANKAPRINLIPTRTWCAALGASA